MSDTEDDALAESIWRPRLLAVLLATFGELTLLLTAIGVLGALATAVPTREHELTVRRPTKPPDRYDMILDHWHCHRHSRLRDRDRRLQPCAD